MSRQGGVCVCARARMWHGLGAVGVAGAAGSAGVERKHSGAGDARVQVAAGVLKSTQGCMDANKRVAFANLDDTDDDTDEDMREMQLNTAAPPTDTIVLLRGDEMGSGEEEEEEEVEVEVEARARGHRRVGGMVKLKQAWRSMLWPRRVARAWRRLFRCGDTP